MSEFCMDFDEYQALAMRTKGFARPGIALDGLHLASNGLSGEAGEFLDYMKKVIWHDKPFSAIYAAEELGDILWYLALASTELGISLEEIAEKNIEKLKKRYPQGFSYKASNNRVN